MNIVTSEMTPDQAAYQFARRLDTLTSSNQARVGEVLQKLLIRTHGSKTLLEAIEEQRILSDPYYNEDGRSNFHCERLSWMATDLNNEIGNNLSVERALEIITTKLN